MFVLLTLCAFSPEPAALQIVMPITILTLIHQATNPIATVSPLAAPPYRPFRRHLSTHYQLCPIFLPLPWVIPWPLPDFPTLYNAWPPFSCKAYNAPCPTIIWVPAQQLNSLLPCSLLVEALPLLAFRPQFCHLALLHSLGFRPRVNFYFRLHSLLLMLVPAFVLRVVPSTSPHRFPLLLLLCFTSVFLINFMMPTGQTFCPLNLLPLWALLESWVLWSSTRDISLNGWRSWSNRTYPLCPFLLTLSLSFWSGQPARTPLQVLHSVAARHRLITATLLLSPIPWHILYASLFVMPSSDVLASVAGKSPRSCASTLTPSLHVILALLILWRLCSAAFTLQ